MLQPRGTGISNSGRAYVFGTPGGDLSPIADGRLMEAKLRMQAAQERQKRQAETMGMVPEVGDEVWAPDVPLLQQQANQLRQKAAELARAGIDPDDMTNPIAQEFHNSLQAYLIEENLSKQRRPFNENFLQTYQAALRDDKVDPSFFQEAYQPWMEQYQQADLDTRRELFYQMPQYQGYSSFSLPQYMEQESKAIAEQTDFSTFVTEDQMGTRTVTYIPESARRERALGALSDPRYVRDLERQYATLPEADKIDIQQRAEANGFTPLQQLSKDTYDTYFGQRKEGGSNKGLPAWMGKLGVDMEAANSLLKEFSFALTSGADNRQYNIEGDGIRASASVEGDIDVNSSFYGMEYGGGEIVGMYANDGGGATILVDTGETVGGDAPGEEERPAPPKRIELSGRDLWNGFIIPMARKHGGVEMVKLVQRVAEEDGMDVTNFDARKFLQKRGLGNSASQFNNLIRNSAQGGGLKPLPGQQQ